MLLLILYLFPFPNILPSILLSKTKRVYVVLYKSPGFRYGTYYCCVQSHFRYSAHKLRLKRVLVAVGLTTTHDSITNFTTDLVLMLIFLLSTLDLSRFR